MTKAPAAHVATIETASNASIWPRCSRKREKRRCKPLLIAGAFTPHTPLESRAPSPPPAHA